MRGEEGMKMSNVVLDVQNLEKTMNKKTILHSLSLQLQSGRILALCGGNGAGKSTLIRTMIGLSNATKGTVTINGVQKKKNRQAFARQFGYMPDDFQFQESIRARETLYFYARLKCVDEERTKEVLQQVGLTEHQHKVVGAFSKGMRQRLLLAQALLTKPPLLVLDEPTNGLDPYWVQTFSQMMVQAKEAGQSVVFSTHDLHVAEEIADEVIFLHDGNVLSKGPIEKYKETGLYETFHQLFFQQASQAVP